MAILHRGSNLHDCQFCTEGQIFTTVSFARRIKFERLSVLHRGSILHDCQNGDKFPQYNTNLKELSKNSKECLFTIKRILLKID